MTFNALPGLTLFSLGLITALAIVFHVRYIEKAAAYGPTILTTVGIFDLSGDCDRSVELRHG